MRLRRPLAWLPGLALAAVLLAPTVALATETETIHFSGAGTEPELINPCSGATGTLTFAYQGVLHITELDRGTYQAALSSTGTWSVVPDDPTQPSYTGHTEVNPDGTVISYIDVDEFTCL